ncbi:hypothetical protein N7522_003112 [Penicillium canescens]|nr:hypothetical protein N7522_003112 [Penicillium canescens]
MRPVGAVPDFDIHPACPIPHMQYDRTILHVAHLGAFHIAMLFCLLVTLFLGVLAVNCTSFIIYSPAGADWLRKNCPIVTGHVAIGPLNDNSTTQHISLDGVEVIEGSFGNYYVDRWNTLDGQPYFTLSSSTLREVRGEVEFGTSPTKLQSLTLPNLKIVNTSFQVGFYARDITYLDISSLESVDYFSLAAPNITTFRHRSLRNATDVKVHTTQIDSLDIVSDSRLKLNSVDLAGPFPNIKNIPVGFTSAEELFISADASVTLGGPSTTNMTIGSLSLSGGVSDLKRSTKLESLIVDSMDLSSSISIPHLEIPFDNLRALTLKQLYEAHPVKDITLPPQAVNWTGGFELDISNAPKLNLTSMYRTDDQNNRVQTWYWPTNISSIRISNANLGNAFFDTFVAQQNASLGSTRPPSVLETFHVYPSRNTTDFNCAALNGLSKTGRLPSPPFSFGCSNSTKTSGSTFIRTASPLHLAGVVFGATMWMV